MNKRQQLIKSYETIIEQEVFSDATRGIDIPAIVGVVQALKAGQGPAHFEEERDINMQHMGVPYFRSIRWTWDRAIRATKVEPVQYSTVTEQGDSYLPTQEEV